jgi:glyoxylase-like metal-dependent hydrolase (beta-lactamase superfamily II)
LFYLVALSMSVVSIVGCSGAQTGEPGAQRALDDAAEAMGGWDALRAVRAQRLASDGSDWEPMQAVQPGETRQINTFSETVTVDFERKAARIAFSAQRVYPAPSRLTFTEVIDGPDGALEQTSAAGVASLNRLHPSRYASRLRDLNRMPVRVLTTASQSAELNRVADQTIDGVTYQIVTYTDAGQTVELHINGSTHLPARVAYMEDDPLLGDTRNEWVWSDWRDVGGVRLPHSEEHQLNGLLIRRETNTDIQNNPAIPSNTFVIAEQARKEPEVGDRIVSEWTWRRAVMGVGFQDFARPQNVELEELAPGVFYARGGTHHSMIVEMKDHLMVFEAPLFEERSLAVIKAIKEKVPGKPIKYVMVTHFHNDHSGGIRAYAAEGATVVAHASIIPFLETVLTRPKTIRPDALALAQAGTSPNVALDGVATMKEYTDGSRVVQVHTIPNAHAQGMLSPYLPKEGIIFVSDLVSPAPGTPVDPSNTNARAFYTAVKELGLKVDRIVGGHGTAGPFRDLATAMEKG